MATSIQSEVPMVGSVAKMVNRLSKVEDPILKMGEAKKAQHIVVYEYKAQQSDEIDLEVGDAIEIMKVVEDGWNRGKNLRTNQSGMYPTNYCELSKPKLGVTVGGTIGKQYSTLKKNEAAGDVPSVSKRVSTTTMESGSIGEEWNASAPSNAMPVKEEPQKEYGRVTFDYVAQHPDELSLKVGQMVLVVNKATTDSGWYEGELDGKRGLFPDNFVSLIKQPSVVISTSSSSNSSQVPSNPAPSISPSNSISSSRLVDKPPASLPGPIPIMSLPPQVPAKPAKSGSGVSVSSTSTVKTSLGWKTSSTPSVPPSMTTSASTTLTTAAVPPLSTVSSLPIKEEEKEKESNTIKPTITSNFKQNQANILAKLNMQNPENGRPSGLSKSSTRIDEEGVINENGDMMVQDQPQLTHPNKSRPKVPSGSRRPVSMFPPPSSDYHATLSKDMMTKSEIGLYDAPAPIGTPISLSPTLTSIAPSIPPKDIPIGSSTALPTATKSSNQSTGVDSVVDSSQYQWVSRSEYNDLLAKVAILEERLSSLERR